MVDDISKKDRLYKDMLFFEKHFKGVMPFEITLDTKRNRGVLRMDNLKKIDQLQDTLLTYTHFSKPLSVVELVKFSKQAFYRGDPGFSICQAIRSAILFCLICPICRGVAMP